MPALYALYIINKSGGLIYNKTLTGTKFLLVVEPGTPEVEDFLKSTVYDLYTDYVLKNPFYEVEMPVRCELFDINLFQTIGTVHKRWGIFGGTGSQP